jgi:hypothetical protein
MLRTAAPIQSTETLNERWNGRHIRDEQIRGKVEAHLGDLCRGSEHEPRASECIDHSAVTTDAIFVAKSRVVHEWLQSSAFGLFRHLNRPPYGVADPQYLHRSLSSLGNQRPRVATVPKDVSWERF